MRNSIKRRRRVTLLVSSSKRDRRNNLYLRKLHPSEAHIAMKVIDLMLDHGAPIYTVHDNFLTRAAYRDFLPHSI